jgi:hypothetical protein
MKATNNIVKKVILPSAVGYAGKEYVVADEVGSAATYAINIFSTSPDKINGGTSVDITTSYNAKSVTSDGTNWFAR